MCGFAVAAVSSTTLRPQPADGLISSIVMEAERADLCPNHFIFEIYFAPQTWSVFIDFGTSIFHVEFFGSMLSLLSY